MVKNEKDPLLPLEQRRQIITKERAADNSNGIQDENSNSNNNDDDDDANPWTDAKDTIRLGIPLFLSMCSWVGMKLTDSALLGHTSSSSSSSPTSSDALAAASLSDLWTMCTAVLIQGRVLGVLTGAAIGAGNPRLAGIYLQISVLVLGATSLFVMASWWCTGLVWRWFGSDPYVASMAGYYATVLSISIPAQVVFGQVSQFFSSQRILHPEVYASATALVLNLGLGLVLVLGVGIPHFSGFGFAACPAVTAAVVYLQVAVLVGWGYWSNVSKSNSQSQPSAAAAPSQSSSTTWDTIGPWDASEWTWTRITTFAQLYVPAALGMASDFWRVAVVGTAAARLGETQVAVFNTSYRLMWMVLIAISALASAAGIKLTLRLGRNQGALARQAGLIGIAMAAIVLVILGGLVYTNLATLGRIFTNDAEFLHLLDEAALPFTITLVLMNFSVALERLPYAMGRTKEVFWCGFVASWGFQVPAVYALTYYWRDDLVGLYTGMAIGYAAVTILYGTIVATCDWDYYAQLAVERSETTPKATAAVNVVAQEENGKTEQNDEEQHLA